MKPVVKSKTRTSKGKGGRSSLLKFPNFSLRNMFISAGVFGVLGVVVLFRVLAANSSVTYSGSLTPSMPQSTYSLAAGAGSIQALISSKEKNLVLTASKAGAVIGTVNTRNSSNVTLSLPNVTADNYTFTVSTTDTSFSKAKKYTLKITYPSKDSNNPTAVITSPLADASVSGAVNFSASATDDTGVAKVEFYVGSALLSTDTATPYTAVWDTTQVADGVVSLTVKSYDTSNNMGQSSTTIVNVSNTITPPSTCPAGQTGTPPNCVTSAPTPLGSIPGPWTLKFQDEFNGSSLDSTKWTPTWLAGTSGYSNPVNTSEDACNHSDQIGVSNGSMKLTATTNSNASCKRRDGTTAPYVSGIVTSYHKYETAYGYFEARVYSPGSNGLMYNWPAFWTDGAGLNWPATGEIDIMEGLSGHQPCWHYHYQDGSGAHQGPGGCPAMDGSGWHTYAVNWQPGQLTYYYDGLQVGVITSGVVSVNHFIILNYGVNEDYGVQANTTMEVDYVRVWGR